MTVKAATEVIVASAIAIAAMLAVMLLAPKPAALGDARSPIFRPQLPLVY